MARPKLPKKKIKKSITFNEETFKKTNSLGGGNLSAGVEILFQFYKAAKQKEKEIKQREKEETSASHPSETV